MQPYELESPEEAVDADCRDLAEFHARTIEQIAERLGARMLRAGKPTLCRIRRGGEDRDVWRLNLHVNGGRVAAFIYESKRCITLVVHGKGADTLRSPNACTMRIEHLLAHYVRECQERNKPS